VFGVLRAWSVVNHAAAASVLEAAATDTEPWTPARLKALLEAYRAEHDGPRLDPEARNLRHTYVEALPDGGRWRVDQVLVDTDMHNDWVASFDVDLAASRAADRPVLRLRRLGPLEDAP
jgi:hypothetical protein